MQNKTTPRKVPPCPKNYLLPLSNDDRNVRGTLNAMGETINGILLDGEDEKQPIRSLYVSSKGGNGTFHSFSAYGKMAATGWKTTVTLSQNDDLMISLTVKLPRGRRSYRTDILAALVTEEVVRQYAEHALVQILKQNNREDAIAKFV